MKLKFVVAQRYPLWLPPLNTGIPPVIDPGDWLLSTWSGRCSQYAVLIDMESWLKYREETVFWQKWEYPPMGLLPKHTKKVLLQYDEDLLKQKYWMEVIGHVEE